MAQGLKYAYIAAGATTQVKTGTGVLHKIIVNVAVASATITISDSTSTTTPTIGIITEPGTLLQNHYILDYHKLEFRSGLRIVTSGAHNLTVIYE